MPERKGQIPGHVVDFLDQHFQLPRLPEGVDRDHVVAFCHRNLNSLMGLMLDGGAELGVNASFAIQHLQGLGFAVVPEAENPHNFRLEPRDPQTR